MTLTKIWLREYMDPAGLCALCGNRGIVKCLDGTGRYCICPNGRGLRRANGPMSTDTQVPDPNGEVFATNKDIYGNDR